MRDNAPVARAINTARARTCFDPSIRLPDTLGSPDPLQAHFWIGKDSGARYSDSMSPASPAALPGSIPPPTSD